MTSVCRNRPLEAVANSAGVAETFPHQRRDRSHQPVLREHGDQRADLRDLPRRALGVDHVGGGDDRALRIDGGHPPAVRQPARLGHPARRAHRHAQPRSAPRSRRCSTFGVHRFTRTNHVGLDYDVIAVDDPWGWSTVASFANFRRAGTNMGNVNRVASSTTTGTPNPTIRAQLEGLMNGATGFHAQTTVPVPDRKARRGRGLHARPVVRPVDRQRRRPAGRRRRARRTGAPGGRAVPGRRAASTSTTPGSTRAAMARGPAPGAACRTRSASRSRAARSCSTTCSSRCRAWPA